jgi:HAD superfamily hydrolase (TIGR01509 family)
MTFYPMTLQWDHIDTVLLDMDGTLLDLHFDNHFWLVYLPIKYAEQRQLALEEAKSWLYHRFEKEKGTLNWYCLDFWSDELQLDIPQLKEDISHLIDIRPYVIPFLNWITQSGRDCYLVTNAHQKSLSLKLEKTSINQYVDKVFCSHDFNAPKESQAFWERFQQHLHFDKTRTLLVDDSDAVLKSAQTYGIQHLLSIQQPDSQLSPREAGEFPAVACYSQLFPYTR